MDWIAFEDILHHKQHSTKPMSKKTKVAHEAPPTVAPAYHPPAPAVDPPNHYARPPAPAVEPPNFYAPAYHPPPAVDAAAFTNYGPAANYSLMRYPNKSNNGVLSPSGAFYEWDKQLVKLPTPQRIAFIFEKLAHFEMLSTLPQRLEYRPTAADTAIAQNIKSLFLTGPEPELVADVVKTALLLVVSRIDVYMTEYQKTQLDRQKSSLTKDQQRHILLFYPNLMALIRVLLIHCQNLVTNTVASSSNDQMVGASMIKCVLDMWQQILGELHELHFVILYASRMDLVSLENYPTEWMQIIQHMNTDIDHLRTTVLALNESLNQNLLYLNERDKQLQSITARFAEVDTKVQFIKAEKNNTLATLESFTSVPSLVAQNMLRMKSAFATFH